MSERSMKDVIFDIEYLRPAKETEEFYAGLNNIVSTPVMERTQDIGEVKIIPKG